MNFWPTLFPAPKNGGPVFFAETCFGAQLGFRWERGQALGCLLDVDTFEMFQVSSNLEELFGVVLADRYAFSDPTLLKSLKCKIGDLPDGMHYAPIISPMAGGAIRIK